MVKSTTRQLTFSIRISGEAGLFKNNYLLKGKPFNLKFLAILHIFYYKFTFKYMWMRNYTIY